MQHLVIGYLLKSKKAKAAEAPRKMQKNIIEIEQFLFPSVSAFLNKNLTSKRQT